MKTALLGLDVGTTSTKAVLFDLNGTELIRMTSSPYRVHSPYPGWVEQDPEELWGAVTSCLRDVMGRVRGQVRVAALCMAVQSGSLLPATELGEPVYPLITWMDGRSESLVQTWREDKKLRSLVKRVSGWSLYPGLCLPTIAWIRHHNPATFEAARRYFSLNDFLVHRLTGEFITNPSNGGGMQLVELHTAQWSDDLCALAGIKPGQLSTIQPSGSLIGEVRPDVCRSTGLTAGTVLVNGGHDQGCTALGLGVTDPGKLTLACGTAWVLTGVVNALDIERVPASLDLNFHTIPHRWTISQSLGGLGASLEWWVNQAWKGAGEKVSRQDLFESLNQELIRTKPGSGLYFIPLTGGHDDPATTRTGGFTGLRLIHNRADMARAIMESAAFELRWTLESVREAGLPVDHLWMVGGAASSHLWTKILADITGIPIYLPSYDNWPALGAALLAGMGIGRFADYQDGLSRFQKPAQEVKPDPEMAVIVDEGFDSYKAYCHSIRR